MSSTFLALDLEGAINSVARCEAPAAMAIEDRGSLVRSRLTHLDTWLAQPGAREAETRDRVLTRAARWGLDPRGGLFVVLNPRARTRAVNLLASLGACRVWLPHGGHAVSPRGLAPAEVIRDYREAMNPPTGLDLPAMRDRFVSMMERAAEDVQALGLEQDDSFFDRFADVGHRREGRRLVLPLETLTDAEWIWAQWRQAYATWHGPSLEPGDIEVLSLHLRCVMDRPDHGFRAPAGEETPLPPEVPGGWGLSTYPTGHLLTRLKPA